MPIVLEGGALVTNSGEGDPLALGALRIRPLFDRARGTRKIALRILELSARSSPSLANAACDEVIYVLEGFGTIFLDGRAHSVAPGTAAYVAPGVAFTLENHGAEPIRIASALCPDPERAAHAGVPVTRPLGSAPETPPLARLEERDVLPTGDRWYRVLVGPEAGSRQVTQFVGGIPPGRAPDHFHHYEEVLVVLSGEGRAWAGNSSAPVGAGSCIYLPPRQIHCMENTGTGELRLLGVFYPAGSPAARYDP